MNAQTGKSQFSFELPSLSYIDAQWEEPNLRTPTERSGSRSGGISGWLSRRIAGFRARRQNSQAARELAGMSDHDLMDIGISRSDLSRVFDPAFSRDLRTRGN